MRRLLTAWFLLLAISAAGLGFLLLAARPALSKLDWPAAPAPQTLANLVDKTQGQPETEAGASAIEPGAPDRTDSQAAPQSKDPSPSPGRIAFVARGGALGTVAPDGTGERQLQVDSEMRFSLPTWSPDASRLAAIGIKGERAGVYLTQDARRAEIRELYEDGVETPFYLYWAPDGRYLGFLANHAEEGIGLQVVEPGTGRRQLLETGTPVYWEWSKETPRVLVHGGEAGAEDGRLGYIDIVTGARESLASPAPASFRTPGISARGRFVSYGQMDDSGQARIVIRDRGDEAAEPVTIDHRGLAAMTWSPGAEQLAFVSPRQSSETFAGPLRLFDAESQDLRSLIDDSVLAFFWSPDGRWIAYFTLDGPKNDGGSRALAKDWRLPGFLPGAFASVAYPAQAPQIEMVLSVIEVERSGRGPRELARFQPSRTFALQVLPFFDQYARSHQLWSPGSDALVLPVLENRGAVIQVVPIDGSSPLRVAEGSVAFWSPR